MPDKRHWSAALAAGLANLAGRLDERHAKVVARDAEDDRRPASGDEPYGPAYEPAYDGGYEPADPLVLDAAPGRRRTNSFRPFRQFRPSRLFRQPVSTPRRPPPCRPPGPPYPPGTPARPPSTRWRWCRGACGWPPRSAGGC
jgi:hypothetical protein